MTLSTEQKVKLERLRAIYESLEAWEAGHPFLDDLRVAILHQAYVVTHWQTVEINEDAIPHYNPTEDTLEYVRGSLHVI